MFKTVGVAGIGQMGSGIAHVFAQNGCRVIAYDPVPAQAAKGVATIAQNLERQAKKGVVFDAGIDEILARITVASSPDEFVACDLIVEAATENEPLKLGLFRTLDGIAPEHAILASNTSSISITRIAAATSRPDRVIGMHFMNPVPVMTLVEVIRGIATSEETFQAVAEAVAFLGKEMATSMDYPGFIVNRILIPMINEAAFALYEGIAKAEDIDRGMKLGTNQPMGPLQLADFIGLDTVLAICKVLYDGFKDPKYRPCPLLVQMVDAGYLGRKSGRGFYSY
ncbi:3-hydroxyacyl-CoA dehydrogenase NAD-binding domain-containing protein [Geomonas oryzae]|uniref:3-hydroxyacyl-CoA dehydrogenase NAD-binding domain-containing protein n=1 Tax=Geomonas oryzae TaxID=2364273 RepID=UPI00100B4EC4|nr:3-hydroxyacyl-CoA dehydrogenase NAD-binding domain-containing protein [Geomonas oryzae]